MTRSWHIPVTTWEGLEMELNNDSAYHAFRKTEAEHVSEAYGTDTEWADRTDWERFHMDAYDASLNSNAAIG